MTILEAIQRTTDKNMALALIGATMDEVDIDLGERECSMYYETIDIRARKIRVDKIREKFLMELPDGFADIMALMKIL